MELKIDPRVAWQVVDGEAVVLDLESGKAVGLNPTGTLVWRYLETEPPEAIARRVAEAFDVEGSAALADVCDFIDLLRRRNLVVDAPASAGR